MTFQEKVPGNEDYLFPNRKNFRKLYKICYPSRYFLERDQLGYQIEALPEIWKRALIYSYRIKLPVRAQIPSSIASRCCVTYINELTISPELVFIIKAARFEKHRIIRELLK
jgi:hypothetical protein